MSQLTNHRSGSRKLVNLFATGLQTLAELLCCIAPNRDECVKLLKGGAVVGVAPGGAGQSMLGLDWKKRTGYALAALQAECHEVNFFKFTPTKKVG